MEHNKHDPREGQDEQWLKELFDSAEANAAEEFDPSLPGKTPEDEQWLKELFASAELSYAPEEPAAPAEPPVAVQQAAEDLTQTPEASDLLPAQEQTGETDATETISEEWINEILTPPSSTSEIGPDENAVSVAGLTKPEDLELEQIMQEALSEDWGADAAEAEHHVEDPILFEIPSELLDESQNEPEEEAPAEQLPTKQEETDVSEEMETAELEQPVEIRKKMPKNKHAYGFLGIPHILSTLIWLSIAVFIGAVLGRVVWTCAEDVLAFNREDKAVIITITESDTLETVTEKLHATGLINLPDLFKLYGGLSDAMEKIEPGTYQLNTLYDYHALVAMMRGNSQRVTIQVQIPEGYSCREIFQLLESKGVCSVAAMEAAAANADLGNYWFLEGVERGSANCLEGYLFPDTYIFYVGDDPIRVLGKFLDNFDIRFTDIMEAKLDTLNATLADMMRKNGIPEAEIAKRKMTIREVIIVASMIEKEAANVSESYIISSVIYNRLTNYLEHPYLNIDACLVYALGGKTDLTSEDKKVDSPYNTYIKPGLPVGPISNPSRSSLDAALDPDSTKWYYYALRNDIRAHAFFETYEEHKAFVDKQLAEEEAKKEEEANKQES